MYMKTAVKYNISHTIEYMYMHIKNENGSNSSFCRFLKWFLCLFDICSINVYKLPIWIVISTMLVI